MTSRGWGSTGQESYGIARLGWNGEIPVHMKQITAQSTGCTTTSTRPVDPQAAADIQNYSVTDFTYNYDSTYGSPVINRQDRTITRLEISDDRLSVRLFVDGLREGYINEISLQGVLSAQQRSEERRVGKECRTRLQP